MHQFVKYQPNWVSLDGVENMRDLGGLRTDDGRMTRLGRVLRSDSLIGLTTSDAHVLLESYRVSDVCDLRTNQERAQVGRGPLGAGEQVTFHDLSLYPPDDPQASTPVWQHDLDSEQVRDIPHAEVMGRHYFGYLRTRPDSILTALGIIAESPGAVVINCAAGKDRTGTMTAVLLGALGVPRATIVADYAASGQRLRRILARMGRAASVGAAQDTTTTQLNEEDLAAVPDEVIANQATPPEAMEILLDLVVDNYGDMPGYLATQGWSRADQQRLEGRLLR